MIFRNKGDWLTAKVGAPIWELIETPHDISSACARLLNEYDVAPEVCCAEVERFLNKLVKHGAIALDPPPVG